MDKGHRLLPAVLDYAGTKTPSNIYASVPRSSDISDGFWNITINEVLRAVDSFAWWLRDHYGPSDNFETLTYVGVSDLRYVMFFYAAVKCGYKVRSFRGPGVFLLCKLLASKVLNSHGATTRFYFCLHEIPLFRTPLSWSRLNAPSSFTPWSLGHSHPSCKKRLVRRLYKSEP